ncbi:MAG: hypothetical protein HN769_03520 [Anaerolineae bacterium]|jgi:hypothetical protein|nr:hypothetical protein [Anaerolineae bacterium]
MGQRSHIHQRMHALIVELALIGPVRLLIGGNRYDHYGINYALAAITSHYEHILDNHIRLSRAETCYQMVELLIETQANETPSLILDFLSVFYDESVAEREVNQLLFEAISALRRLSQQSMAVLSVHPSQNRPRLLKVLENTVDRIECPTAQYPEPISQHRLIR